MTATAALLLPTLHLLATVSAFPFGPSASTSAPSIAIPPASSPMPSPADPPAATSVFDVRAFGATGNSTANDTAAFLAAWSAACAAESRTLLVPAGGVFTILPALFLGPCLPGLAFQVDGTLMPPDGPENWPEGASRRNWLVFHAVDSMELRGGGTIVGNGEKWWALPCKPHRGPGGSTLGGRCDSPALLIFHLCTNLLLRDLCIVNSPQVHVKLERCDGVRVEGLSIASPPDSPNTDGIHLAGSSSVGIYDTTISNGDDCLSIGSGCSRVDVGNLTCEHGHGISIGSLGERNSRACVSDVAVRGAAIRSAANGLRIKTWQGGWGAVARITFDDVRMENVRNCIVVDQYYCVGKRCANQSQAVYVSEVSYSNVRGTYDARAPPVRLACSDAVPCTGIAVAELELVPHQGELRAAEREPFCWNAYGIVETVTVPPVACLRFGMPEWLQYSDLGYACDQDLIN